MDFLQNIEVLIQQSPALAYLAVFAGGLLSAANPCVLISIPLIIGYVGGYAEGNRGKAALFSGAFVLGLSITFTALGLIAALAGSLFGSVGDYWKYIVAAVVILLGLSMLGVFRLPLPEAKPVAAKRRGLLGALLLGLLFGVVSSPCATPVLAALLALLSTQKQVLYGGSLMFVYALGHCALMFIAGLSTGLASKLISSRGLSSFAGVAKKISGAVILAVGVYLIIGL